MNTNQTDKFFTRYGPFDTTVAGEVTLNINADFLAITLVTAVPIAFDIQIIQEKGTVPSDVIPLYGHWFIRCKEANSIERLRLAWPATAGQQILVVSSNYVAQTSVV